MTLEGILNPPTVFVSACFSQTPTPTPTPIIVKAKDELFVQVFVPGHGKAAFSLPSSDKYRERRLDFTLAHDAAHLVLQTGIRTSFPIAVPLIKSPVGIHQRTLKPATLTPSSVIFSDRGLRGVCREPILNYLSSWVECDYSVSAADDMRQYPPAVSVTLKGIPAGAVVIISRREKRKAKPQVKYQLKPRVNSQKQV
jgi:hypothetical protein